jgi:hypothetical protein
MLHAPRPSRDRAARSLVATRAMTRKSANAGPFEPNSRCLHPAILGFNRGTGPPSRSCSSPRARLWTTRDALGKENRGPALIEYVALGRAKLQFLEFAPIELPQEYSPAGRPTVPAPSRQAIRGFNRGTGRPSWSCSSPRARAGPSRGHARCVWCRRKAARRRRRRRSS